MHAAGEETVRFDGDKYKYLVIRKRVRTTVRKTGERKASQTIKRGQGKYWAKQRALRGSTNAFVRK